MGSALRWKVLIGSLTGGSLLYALLVLLLYNGLVEHVAHHAVPPALSAWVALTQQTNGSKSWCTDSAQWLLQEPDIKDARSPVSATSLAQSLACPGHNCSAYPVRQLRSAVEATASLAIPFSTTSGVTGSATETAEAPAPIKCAATHILQCGNNRECEQRTQRAIARLLVGSLGCEKKDALALRNPFESCWYKPTLSAAWQPKLIATWMGLCQPDAAGSCKIATYLLQGALDDPGTRNWQIAFGLVWGFGRWLVLVLALGVMAALCWRQRVLRVIERDLASIITAVSQSKGPSANNAERRKQIENAWRLLHPGAQYTPPSNPSENTAPSPHAVYERPDPLHEPVESLLYQADRSHVLNDRTPVRDSARQSRHEMNGWWKLLTTVVTVFPVIGLAATLNGLIHAFAKADQIAVAVGDARASAIRAMVAELSASFSTTLVALVLMSLLTLWTLRARHAEQRAFTRAVENIDEAMVYLRHAKHLE
jgi:biopolymer transport protein ExbB/TolQ